MNYLNSFKNFESVSNNSNRMVIWSTKDGNYSRKIGCIFDVDYNLLDTIDNVFNRSGNWSDELINKCNKHGILKIKGENYEVIANSTDTYPIVVDEMTPEEAILRIKNDDDDMKSLSDWITPEKEAELINLFKRKENE